MAANYRTLQEIVYEKIRESILDGRYEAGQRLVTDDLAAELGVSRMPVREALHRLEAAGLVNMTPHRGAVVSEISESEVLEIYRIRAVLEGLATRLAATQLTADDFARINVILGEMWQAAASGDVKGVLRTNREFHQVLWDATSSPRLSGLLQNLYDASQRYRNYSTLIPGRFEQIVEEHKQIIDALAASNIELAEHLASKHVEDTARGLLALIEAKRAMSAPETES